MNSLKLYLFGPVRIEHNDATIVLTRRKVVAILAYLALTRQIHRRDTLATLFWPEADQATARSALRRDFYGLTNALGHDCFVSDRESIGLAPDVDLWIDAEEFQVAIAGALSHAHEPAESCLHCLPILQRAVDIYADEFLVDMQLDDCPEYMEWQRFKAEELRHACAAALDLLVGFLQAVARYDDALPYARRRLALDLMHEPAHQMLIRLFALAGQIPAALRQYDECKRILAADLGITPTAETMALYEAIRTRNFPTQNLTAATQPPVSLQQTPPPQSLDDRPRHNLPTPTTTFVGREHEVETICHLLVNNAECRLLTLLGPGGIGKTRLALRVAQTLFEQAGSITGNYTQQDGAWEGIFFVPLAAVADESDLIGAIANAVNYSFRGSDDPQTQLIEFLRPQSLLLVVDNVEHLLDGAPRLSVLLQAAPQVSILATSRETLELPEEWLYPLGGLVAPQSDAPLAAIAENHAVTLFVERAKQAQRGFALTPETTQPIVRICQLTDGMPLGLELAAAWVNTLTVTEIADEIAENLDILASDRRNIPERHRSLRAVFEQTWRRLTTVEQQTLRRLAIFRGTFTREAAQEITETSLAQVSALVHKTLCRHQAGRYDIHELLRQFAFTHLTTAEAAELQNRHSQYFGQLLRTQATAMWTASEPEMLQTITADFDNILAAWRYLSTKLQHNEEVASALRMQDYIPALAAYFDRRSMFWEGQRTFQQALSTVVQLRRGSGNENSAHEALYFQLRVEQIGINMHLGHYHEAKEQLLRFLPELRAAASSKQIADALTYLGPAHMRVGEYVAAEQFLEEALARYEQLGLPLASTVPLINLGLVKTRREQYEAARSYYQRAILQYEEVGYAHGLARCLSNLGSTFAGKENAPQAIAYFEQAYAIAKESDNRLWLAIILTNLADCAYALGDYPLALEQFDAGLAIFRALREIRWVAVTLADSSFLLMALNELTTATTYLLESLTLAQAYQLIGDGLQALSATTLLLERLQQREAAVTIAAYVLDDHRARSAAHERCAQVVARIRKRLDKAHLDEAEFRGRSMPFELIVPHAIQILEQSQPS